MRRACWIIVSLGLLASGCWESLDDASCPPEGTELTYENFGELFFATHCNTCHSAPTNERRGAPGNYVFDTQQQIRDHAERIFERSAGGNDSMPPGPDDPPLEQRQDLAEWLACGAP